MLNKLIFLSIAVVTIIVPVLSVQKCYVCEHFDLIGSNATHNNEKCKDSPPPEEFLKTCNETIEDSTKPTDWQCALVRGRIEVDEENYNIVSRFCVPGKSLSTDCKNLKSYETNYGFIKRGSECVCDDKDGCNSGNGLTFGMITLGLGLVASQL